MTQKTSLKQQSEEQEQFSISELAREFNVTTRAIRFYEDKGLINPQREGTRRIYLRRDRTRLRLVLRAKRLGLTLAEAGELFALYDSPSGEESQIRYFLSLLQERRTIIEQQQRDIEIALQEIDRMEASCHEKLAGS